MNDAVVIDTNVPKTANGKEEAELSACVEMCQARLMQIMQGMETLVLDDNWHILGEYADNLNESGQPGIGDRFFKWALENRRNTRCQYVHITPISLGVGFKEFPRDSDLARFDPDDEKYVAVAIQHEDAVILQATDSLWWELKDALARHVRVDFLCASYLHTVVIRRKQR